MNKLLSNTFFVLMFSSFHLAAQNPINKSYRNVDDGHYEIKRSNGTLDQSFTKSNGNLQGERKIFFRSGKLYSSENFKDGHYNGWSIYLNEKGDTINADLYAMDTLLYTKSFEYYKNGAVSDMYWTKYEKDATLDVNPFHGFWFFGKRTISNNRVDKVTHHHGEHTIYFESGSIKGYSETVNNKFNGAYLLYYESGSIERKATCKDDSFEGPYFEYFENGELKISANFLDGEHEGTYFEYNIDGTIKKQFEYKKGKKVKE